MNDLMLYVMVGLLVAMFGWAGYEYAKAGYEFWRERRKASLIDESRKDRQA